MNKIAIFAAIIMLGAGAGMYVFQMNESGNKDPATDSESADLTTEIGGIRFQLQDANGELRHSSEWDGKARIINFWATWCAPCRREIPLLKATQETFASSNVQIIGIAVDFPDAVAAYAEEAEFNYPILVGQEDAMAVAESSGIEFIGLPFTMVVSADGDLLKNHIGEIVESHIEKITMVFAQMERGELNLADARSALRDL